LCSSLSYNRARYFYCPHPTRHPQVPKRPETFRASGPRVQRLSRQGAGAEASFCLFWPRATASVRGRNAQEGRGGNSDASRSPRSARFVPPPPSPGPPERGVTKRRRNAPAAAPRRRGRGGPLAAEVASAPPPPARPPSESLATGRCKASWEDALAPEGRVCARRQRRRRGYKRERGGGRRKWAVRRRLVLLFGVWAPGGAFSGGPPVQAALTQGRFAPGAPCACALPVPQGPQHGAGGVRVPEPKPAGSRLGGDAALRGRDGQTLAPPPGVSASQCRGPGPRHRRDCGRGERSPHSAAPAAGLLLHGLGEPCLPRVPVSGGSVALQPAFRALLHAPCRWPGSAFAGTGDAGEGRLGSAGIGVTLWVLGGRAGRASGAVPDLTVAGRPGGMRPADGVVGA
jgi:hypothetical protein